LFSRSFADGIAEVENPSDQRNLERLQLACHVFGAELLLVQDAKPQDWQV